MTNQKPPIQKPPIKTRNWPEVVIEGGPHSKNLEFTQDGETMKGISRVEAVFDVQDAVRITVHHYVEYAKLRVKGVIHHRLFLKGVTPLKLKDEEGETFGQVVETSGVTLEEALQNLLDAVKSGATIETVEQPPEQSDALN